MKQQLITDFRYLEIGTFWERFGAELREKAKIEWTPEGKALRDQAAERQKRFNEKVELLVAEQQEKARRSQERLSQSPAK